MAKYVVLLRHCTHFLNADSCSRTLVQTYIDFLGLHIYIYMEGKKQNHSLPFCWFIGRPARTTARRTKLFERSWFLRASIADLSHACNAVPTVPSTLANLLLDYLIHLPLLTYKHPIVIEFTSPCTVCRTIKC
jgi:hypothetical protein